MRIIIAGSRTFRSYQQLKRECDKVIYALSTPEKIVIVSGRAKGADKLGEQYAKERGYEIAEFPAEWDNLEKHPLFIKTDVEGRKYNALAGHNRNREMAEFASKDHGVLVAFWDGHSTGTGNMLKLAKEFNLQIFIIRI